MLDSKIKKLLLKGIPHNDSRRLLAEHGIDILISDGRNLLCVILVSFLINNTDKALLYIVVLSTMRVHTGGWHASTELKCFITYQGMFLLFSYFNSFFIPINISIIIVVFSVLYIIHYSPIEHKYNPLSVEEIKRNRIFCSIYCIAYSILFLSLIKYSYTYAQAIAVTFIFNVALMELLRKSENYRYYDY